MLSKILQISKSTTPYFDISETLKKLHREGPATSDILESLALYKEFHREEFEELEEQIISALGLFYKVKNPSTLYSLLLSAVGAQHKAEYDEFLTPVQASVRRAVDENQFISISAPTSAGKSYSIRDFIAEEPGDAVVIVPSRALIAEYINTMRRRFDGDKKVMISPFVDSVFTSRDLRRIFILTPERARELFSLGLSLDIRVFFFDEAQVSEEPGRGVVFDVLVRRIKKSFPKAKLIFAHPFVENPDAQFKKHNISDQNSFAKSYSYGAVGKISIFRHKNGKDLYFSPFEKDGYYQKKCIEFEGGFEKFAFNGEHSLLIFVSKTSIYNDKFLSDFLKHIDKFQNITDGNALKIIQAVEHILGADESEHRSKLVSLLRKGVVIHHGSVPLEVRFLVEDFIRGGHARICFATSTLAQGINMPFDIVWLKNMRISGEKDKERSLSFKNLIGRAGRLSTKKIFDYGYVFTESPQLYTKRVNDTYSLSEISVIDSDFADASPDTQELMSSIKSGTFNDEYNMPKSKVERLSSPEIIIACRNILDRLYEAGNVRDSIAGEANKTKREHIRSDLKLIFETSINRELLKGEEAVFKTASMIFLLTIQGRTFREIAGIRYSNISKRNIGHVGDAAFSQQANKLPDSKLEKAYPLFKGIKARDVSYDAIIFDTYDYLDQVISFSLSDVFSAAFRIYGKLTSDSRSEKMVELLRYGTNNVIHMLLMRYGFSPEAVTELTPYIKFVNEQNIIFSPEVEFAPQYIKDMVSWYLP
ncbi:DEAD/DEAH box helicase [Pseudomonas sp. NFIX10]|uniref:DEAD/DEAH box helicase n=1 Tax=unclassified Pseudomonas TaxID=196821 RepID=UPI0008F0EF6D|nr:MULTISPECIES: DEAD/DEAH box helicase [unclassified Pseudomonas]SFB05869.1 DEAD/DEAH box helicase [Pseudomonas sp. NFIX10]SFF57518.1 DEAD/DEAH box helicase [Pseudomonas sp. NFACC06-1]